MVLPGGHGGHSVDRRVSSSSDGPPGQPCHYDRVHRREKPRPRIERWAKFGRHAVIPGSPFALSFVPDPLHGDRLWALVLLAMFVGGISADLWLRRLEADRAASLREKYDADLAKEKGRSTRLLQDVSQAVWSFSNRLGQVSVKTPAARRENQDSLINELATELRAIMHERHEKVRVSFFIMNNGEAGERIMKPFPKGRARDTPRAFEENDGGRGSAAFNYAGGGAPLICNDVDEHPPEGWEGTESDYAAFVSCPLAIEDQAYGMVSVDSPAKGTFSEDDRAIVMNFAAQASLALRVVEGKQVG